MPGTIDDRRDQDDYKRTLGFVVATDTFMSHSPFTKGKSLFAVPFETKEEADIIVENMKGRSEMKRVRLVGPNYKPSLKDGDYLSLRSFGDTDGFRQVSPG